MGKAVVERLNILGGSPLDIDNLINLVFERHELTNDLRVLMLSCVLFELEGDKVAEDLFGVSALTG